MNEFDFKTLKEHPAYSLTESERASMRAHLASLAARDMVNVRTSSSPVFLGAHRASVFAFALVCLVVTGGVSVAAEQAVPGDTLYSVKIGITEPTVALLTFGDVPSAELSVRQAEERLREVEVLAARDTLTDEQAQTAVTAFMKNVTSVTDTARALSDEGDQQRAHEVQTTLALALEVHAQLMQAQSDSVSETSRTHLQSFAGTLALAAREANERQYEGNVVDTEALSRIASEKQERAYEQIEELRERVLEGGIPRETEEALTGEVALLSNEYEAVASFLELEDYEQARRMYEEVGRRAKRAYTLLRSAQDIAEKTEKEVVIVLAPSVTESIEEPVTLAARAKGVEGTEQADAASMTMSALAEPETALLDTALFVESAPAVESVFEFRLRPQEED